MTDDNKTIAQALKEIENKTADRSEIVPLLKSIERNTAKGVSSASTSIGRAVEKAVTKAAIKSEKRQKVSVANKRQMQASTAIVASSKSIKPAKQQASMPGMARKAQHQAKDVNSGRFTASAKQVKHRADTASSFAAAGKVAQQRQQNQNDKLASILKDAVLKKNDGSVKNTAGKLAFGPFWDIGKELKEAADDMKANAKDEKSTLGRMKNWGKDKLGIGGKGPAKDGSFAASGKGKAQGKAFFGSGKKAVVSGTGGFAAKGTATQSAGGNNGGGGGILDTASNLKDLWQNRKGVSAKPGTFAGRGAAGAARGGMMARGAGVLRAGAGAAGSLASLAGPLVSGLSLPLIAAGAAAAFGVQQFTKALTTGESDVYNWFKKITGIDPSKETQADKDKAAKVDQQNLDALNKGRAPDKQMIRTADGNVVRADAKKNMELTAQELRKKGMSDEMVTATLANVQKESGGISRTENMNYKNQSNDRIRTIFGSSVKGKTDEEITALKNGPEDQFAEAMYGKGTKKGRDMGNTEAGDGYKFRGRGLVQLTGKANYASMSQKLYGDDRLVKNPELANDSETAAKITAEYMSSRQKSAAKKLGLSTGTTNQDEANKIATQAVMGNGVDINGKRAQQQLATVQAASKGTLVQGAVKATAGGKTVEPPSRQQVAVLKPEPKTEPAKSTANPKSSAAATVAPAEQKKTEPAAAATAVAPAQQKQAEKATATAVGEAVAKSAPAVAAPDPKAEQSQKIKEAWAKQQGKTLEQADQQASVLKSTGKDPDEYFKSKLNLDTKQQMGLVGADGKPVAQTATAVAQPTYADKDKAIQDKRSAAIEKINADTTLTDDQKKQKKAEARATAAKETQALQAEDIANNDKVNADLDAKVAQGTATPAAAAAGSAQQQPESSAIATATGTAVVPGSAAAAPAAGGKTYSKDQVDKAKAESDDLENQRQAILTKAKGAGSVEERDALYKQSDAIKAKREEKDAIVKKDKDESLAAQADTVDFLGNPIGQQAATVPAVSATQPPLPQPQPLQAPPPQPVEVPGLEKLAAANDQKPASADSGSEGKKTSTPNIKTEFDDTMLVLMCYDRT